MKYKVIKPVTFFALLSPTSLSKASYFPFTERLIYALKGHNFVRTKISDYIFPHYNQTEKREGTCRGSEDQFS